MKVPIKKAGNYFFKMDSDARKYSLDRLSLNVTDHVPAMLAYWDKNLVCRFANMAYTEWFGLDREKMIDRITLREVLGALYEKNVSYINGALRGEKQIFEREIVTPSGELRHSLATYIPDVSDGEVHGFFVHVADIGPVKRLEEALIRTNKIINEQNKRLLNFANIVSHNLRSYASNFQSLVELISDEKDESAREIYLKHLKSVSQSFNNTIGNLDEIVHAQNLSNLKAEPISIRDYIDRAMRILQPNIEAARAVVSNEADPSVILELNSAYMESILVNLLSNAIKYRDPQRPAAIRFTTISEKQKPVLRVEDNGLGIDLRKHGEQIFGMYKTFHGNADAKGIGLFITR
ncbi:MAG TPA: HAMP domain-containing sensor histidine kinase, partial [Sphingobacteriaceae bacterium]